MVPLLGLGAGAEPKILSFLPLYFTQAWEMQFSTFFCINKRYFFGEYPPGGLVGIFVVHIILSNK